jgi:hypothetical protein
MGCCLAAAVCDEGDRYINGPGECPPDADCYSRSICCSTQWCVRENVNCDAIPVCDPGDREIEGECPPAYTCYPVTLCGMTIQCLDGGPAPINPGIDGGSCDPSAEHGRHYVTNDPRECLLIDFACPTDTDYFDNDCGCGCEQPADCPEFVNCMPGNGSGSELCTDSESCPYTIRAL